MDKKKLQKAARARISDGGKGTGDNGKQQMQQMMQEQANRIPRMMAPGAAPQYADPNIIYGDTWRAPRPGMQSYLLSMMGENGQRGRVPV